ncbi:MAG: hypothetical protein ACR2QM_20295 [Longimicrobiales bacterium]
MNPDADSLIEARAAITRLEGLAVPPGEFNHRAHVRMAWNYLRLYPVHEVLGRFSAALKAFATSAGAPKKYHETITWALILVVQERLNASDTGTWAAFAEDNPDLFVWPGGALSQYYSPELLASDRARRTFAMPDRVAP